MRRAFYEEVGEHISKIDKEILTWTYRKDTDDSNKPKAIDIDTIIAGDDDVTHWSDRHTVWYESEQAKGVILVFQPVCSQLKVDQGFI